MVSARSLIITFLLVGLFTYALVSFSSQFNYDNNLNQSILNDETFVRLNSSLEESLSSSQGVAEEQKTNVESETRSEQPGFLSLGSIREAWKAFTGTTSTIFNLILRNAFMKKYFPAIIGTVFSAILLVTIIFLGWRAIKSGE